MHIDPADDFEDIDCKSCGKKFFVRPSLFAPHTERVCPTECTRCQQGLPPSNEY